MVIVDDNESRLIQAIQENILSDSHDHVEHYDIATAWVPAKEFAGDFYGYSQFRKHNITLYIGDVVDKGLPAAMYMSHAYGLLQSSLDFMSKASPAKILQYLNKKLLETVPKDFSAENHHDMNLTMLLGNLNTRYHTFNYARAGHEYPMVMDADGNLFKNGADVGMALGVWQNPNIGRGILKIPPGGMLFMYTDGVSDEIDKHKNLFGKERLGTLIKDNRTLPAKEICNIILDELKAYREEAPQFDDCTLMIAKRDNMPDHLLPGLAYKYLPKLAGRIFY